MTTFITELQALCAAMNTPPAFFHEQRALMNIKADDETSTVMFVNQLGTGKIRKVGGGFQETQKIIVAFISKTEFENDMNANETIVDSMKALAIEFLQRLNASSVFLHPIESDTEYVYEQFDANFAGIALTIDLTLKQPLTTCIV